MVRKTKEESEKTRLLILNTALDVFSEKGFVRSTLKDIATRAGMTRGAIYWHFKDKVDLFEALSQYISECSDTTLEDLLEHPPQTLDELTEVMTPWFHLFEDNERFRTFWEFTSYKIEYHEDLEENLEKKRAEKRKALEFFRETFERLQRNGEMRPDLNPYHSAVMLVSTIWGLMEVWLFDQSLFSIKTEGAAMLKQLLDSYKVTHPVAEKG